MGTVSMDSTIGLSLASSTVRAASAAAAAKADRMAHSHARRWRPGLQNM